MSKLPPNAPLRHLDLRENCENNGIAEEKVKIIRAALLLTDVITSQAVLAGEISIKRGKRDTGRDTEEKHTEKTR